MIDITTIVLIAILVSIGFLIYKLNKSTLDEEKIRLQIESDLTEKFRDHLNSSNKSFLDLAETSSKHLNRVYYQKQRNNYLNEL